ncbi:MAG: glycosyltransferase family 4 protein [Gammaproteobacteria bacterium]|nr:glycosyltransferase family 4 protein [Gammaproteobacteria bacterium]
MSQWVDYAAHANKAWSASKKSANNTGVITVFPQLALMAGLRKRFAPGNTPLLSWTFNLGGLYGNPKKSVAKFALRSVDHFVVHSRQEINSYSNWLGIDSNRFEFVALQKPMAPIKFSEDMGRPFVLSMGSARRDYRLFFEVMADLGYPTIVVAGAHAVEGLHKPNNVTLLQDIDISQCLELVQKARVNVVPIDNPVSASGQVTLLDAMMYARPTVATHTMGTEDYVADGETGLLVNPCDPVSMKNAIRDLWNDQNKRQHVGQQAREYVKCNLSDEVAGQKLGEMLDMLEDRYKWPG